MKYASPWILLLLAAALVSCGTSDPAAPNADATAEPNFGPGGIPPHMRAKTAEAGSRVAPGGNGGDLSGFRTTPLADIVFTNPDNPDQPIPELADVLSAPKAKTWEESDTIARARAAREGKPVLIWFTDSQSSPLCKALSQELFADPKFEAWAEEKLVRLRIDARFRVKDPEIGIDEAKNLEINVKHYVTALKKRYKVMGHPTLVMLNPSGEVIGRYGGYKRGTADFVWGQLKHAESVSTRAYTTWRSGMEKKGYREWQDRRERKIFAKLVSYANGELVLIDPDGSRFRTQEAKLCDRDQEWLAAQKKLRNMP